MKNNKQVLSDLLLTQELMHASRSGWHYIENHFMDYSLSTISYNILLITYIFDGISQESISKSIKMDKSSVAKVVNKLIRMELMHKTLNSDDRRMYNLHVTDAGKIICDKLIKCFEEWQSMVLSGISKEEIEVFFNTLAKINLNIEEKNL